MYCLNCGSKIEDDQIACPQCGLTVSAMRERLTRATEVLAYNKDLAPDKTAEMPRITSQMYLDEDGNVIVPELEQPESDYFKNQFKKNQPVPVTVEAQPDEVMVAGQTQLVVVPAKSVAKGAANGDSPSEELPGQSGTVPFSGSQAPVAQQHIAQASGSISKKAPHAQDAESTGEIPVVESHEGATEYLPQVKPEEVDAHVDLDKDSTPKVYTQPLPGRRFNIPWRLVALFGVIAALILAALYIVPQMPLEQWRSMLIAEIEQKSESSQKEALPSPNMEVAQEQVVSPEIQTSKAIYQSLYSCWVNLDEQAKQVEDCVTKFGDDYASPNRSKREKKAKACDTLLAQIHQAQDGLAAYMKSEGVTDGTPYWGQYQSINKLYDHLATRMQIICDCWSRSLEYDEPADNQEAILKPLVDDLKGTGNSRSMEAYYKEYPKAEPHYLEP